ncbi:glycosyltransferase family protein [Aurantimonas endophytica]|uniref:Spore maturation protein CgeB n=1 Tax=Aurantimonas endophytica TaxID=1522175 RepID=A0A7W6HGX3_9HYPH|nr:spore maturation protein CgeB [Aurantimonas endophytica]MCO6405524.1 glycosyltransferase [Aurantimonas endophytica]
MKIAFYGSSILSSYWNGAATYYRGLLRALAAHGHDITFYEPDAYGRQENRDIDPPDWCRVVVYAATPQAAGAAVAEAADADVVVKASGVGYADDWLLGAVFDAAQPQAVKIFWDVDAPATLAELHADPGHPGHAAIARLDAVLTYGGGDPVVEAYRRLGAAECVPIYNALDPSTHHPVAADERFAAALGFLGNRLPDREARVEQFFLEPAARLPDATFLLGGSGWGDRPLPENVRHIGHVGTRDHNAFNVTPKAVLNINRASMAETGFSPPTRVFEAAGAGACLITDEWPGIDLFLKPGEEVLVARDGRDVVDLMAGLDDERAARIGRAALARVLKDHTYEQRAVLVDALLHRHAASRRERASA